MKWLDGDLATVSVDPNDPQPAISEMERAIDAKLARYRGNPLVDKIAKASKEHFREVILKRVEEKKSAK